MADNTRGYRVLCATGSPLMNDRIKRLEIVTEAAECSLKAELSTLLDSFSPDIVIISDKLSGDEEIIKTMLREKRNHQDVRFIYLAGEYRNRDKARKDQLGLLVTVGIYDIVIARDINIDIIEDTILHPYMEESVAHYTDNLFSKRNEIINANSGLVFQDFLNEEDVESRNGIYVFSSIKPGSGKSFISTNVAAAIAKYGKGHPRVALVEADLQTLSLGNILKIKDDKEHSIATAMHAISKVYTSSGRLSEDTEEVKRARREVQRSFSKYSQLGNMDVITGSSLTMSEIADLKIQPVYYDFLLDSIKNVYDVVIVDLNSSLYHISGMSALNKSKTCFYVLNLDYNNVDNNVKYKKDLAKLNLDRKTRYVLNQVIENTDEYEGVGVGVEPLLFTPDLLNKHFEFAAKIPQLIPTVFLNRLAMGTPVVLDDPKEHPYTAHTKYALMQLANEIYPLNESYDRLKDYLYGSEKKKSGSIFKGLFHKNRKPVETSEEVEVKMQEELSDEVREIINKRGDE